MHFGCICRLAWTNGKEPGDWTKAIVILVFRKGDKVNVGTNKELVYWERVQNCTNDKISEEQGELRKGKECVGKILNLGMVVYKC